MDNMLRDRLELIERTLYHREGMASHYWRDRCELEDKYIDRGQFNDATWVSTDEGVYKL